MDVNEIVAALGARYPGSPIIQSPHDAPTEIACMFMCGKAKSASALVIERSKPHYYKDTTVKLAVARGKIDLYLDGRRHSLKRGETERILPEQVRHIEARGGKPAWLIVVHTPPFTEEDEIWVGDDDSATANPA